MRFAIIPEPGADGLEWIADVDGATILRTSVVPRWIGWLGLFTAAVAGWLGLLSPASSTIEGITVLGFIAFFVFMLSMGIALLLRARRATA